jgi:hypothetical protein
LGWRSDIERLNPLDESAEIWMAQLGGHAPTVRLESIQNLRRLCRFVPDDFETSSRLARHA